MAGKPNRMQRAVGSLANRVRGLFRWSVATSVDSSDVPVLIEIENRGNRELVQPFGFKAVPKAKNGSGEPFYLTAGQGSDAIALACVDFRFEPTDVAAGESRMYNATGQKLDCKATGFECNTTMDATGFKAGATPGVSGTLVVAVTADSVPLIPPPLTVVVKGGIVTSVTAGAEWTVAGPGDVMTITWTASS